LELASNPYTGLINNPQTVLKWLTGKQWCQTLNDLKNMEFILPVQTQDYQAGELRRWICTNISEICVQGDEGTPLLLAYRNDIGIRCTFQVLLNDGNGIIANPAQQISYLDWEVLVNLETHRVFYAGITTTRSRANSAAYVIAACIASRFRDG